MFSDVKLPGGKKRQALSWLCKYIFFVALCSSAHRTCFPESNLHSIMLPKCCFLGSYGSMLAISSLFIHSIIFTASIIDSTIILAFPLIILSIYLVHVFGAFYILMKDKIKSLGTGGINLTCLYVSVTVIVLFLVFSRSFTSRVFFSIDSLFLPL